MHKAVEGGLQKIIIIILYINNDGHQKVSKVDRGELPHKFAFWYIGWLHFQHNNLFPVG